MAWRNRRYAVAKIACCNITNAVTYKNSVDRINLWFPSIGGHCKSSTGDAKMCSVDWSNSMNVLLLPIYILNSVCEGLFFISYLFNRHIDHLSCFSFKISDRNPSTR